MVKDAIDIVYAYEHMGCVFSRTPDGRIAQRRFGGHSTPRANYAADWTGHVLLHTIHEQAHKHGVKFYSEWFALDLIVEDRVCKGVVAMNIQTGEIITMRAKAVMFGTGGYGRAWKITSNALANTGDGVAIAYNAGIPLMDPGVAAKLDGQKIMEIPGLGLSVQVNTWVDVNTRARWASYDLAFGAAVAEATALTVVKSQ